MQSGADIVIDRLKQAGVRVVFGIPSIHNLGLYEALRKESSIRHILCRHESMATHMAEGYARAGNQLGVVITSTGPGTGYVVPALQEAWGKSSPVLTISTNIPTSKIGKGMGLLHEFERQDTLFRHITKATITVRSESEIHDLTQRAIYTALSGRPGPVYLELPFDLLDKEVSGKVDIEPTEKEISRLPKDIKTALSLLKRARQPILIVGQGVVSAGIEKDIITLAEKLCAPVITTTIGKGVINEDHVLSFGNAARKGVVRETVRECDVALAVGTRLREVDAKRRGMTLPTLIHVDWDDQWINKNFKTEVALIGDIKMIVKGLLDKLEPGSNVNERRTWIEKKRKGLDRELEEIRDSNLEMQYLHAIRKTLPRDSILVADNTLLGYWVEFFYPTFCPGGLIGARGSTIIGYSFAAAMGAKIAKKDHSIVALIGDGGFLYSSQELATCVRHNIGFPLVIINDNAYGVIAYLQRMAYGVEYESRLVNPDFVALARAYGVKASRVDSPSSFEKTLKKALASGLMWVIEITESFKEPPFSRY
jgi:acetolactate synthase-1/2/3 large subunit